MTLSRLLLVAANSRKQIRGEKRSKVVVNPRHFPPGSRDPYEGEVILCFEIDRKQDEGKKICRSLGIEDDSKCDGIIFYSQDDSEDRVICLVEMKHTQIDHVIEQIKSTKDHIKEMLQIDCGDRSSVLLQHIKWKACFYHSNPSLSEVASIKKELKDKGFSEVASFTSNNNDIGPFLRGEQRNEDIREYARKKGKRR